MAFQGRARPESFVVLAIDGAGTSAGCDAMQCRQLRKGEPRPVAQIEHKESTRSWSGDKNCLFAARPER